MDQYAKKKSNISYLKVAGHSERDWFHAPRKGIFYIVRVTAKSSLKYHSLMVSGTQVQTVKVQYNPIKVDQKVYYFIDKFVFKEMLVNSFSLILYIIPDIEHV